MRASPRRPLTALLLAVLPAAAGCCLFRAIVATPRLRDAGARLVSANFDEATVEFRFTLENPNAIGATLYRLDYTLDVGGSRCAYGETPDGYRVDLPARGSADVVLPVKVPYAGAFAALKEGWEKDEIPYELRGGVRILEPVFGGIRIPLSKEGTLPSLRPPAIGLKSLRVETAGLTSLRLGVVLEIENRNRTPLRVEKLTGTLSLNGAEVARIPGIERGDDVPGKQTSLVTIPVEVSLLALGLKAKDIYDAGKVTYKLDGEATFELMELGKTTRKLKLEGETTFSRKGG